MNIEQIRQLVADLTAAGLSGAEIDKPGFKLTLKRGVAGEYSSSTEAVENQAEPDALQIRASGVGRLLLAHPDDSKVLAPVGSDIRTGQLVAILAIDTLLLPVRSHHAGRICSVLVANGTTVSYGQPLISLLPFDADTVQP